MGLNFLPKRDSICEFWLALGSSPPNRQEVARGLLALTTQNPADSDSHLRLGRERLVFTFAAP